MKKRTKKRTKKQTNGGVYLDDQNLASIRMTAIQVAAALPEASPPSGGLGGYPGAPGKSASKVVADAATIMAFVTKR